MRNPTTLQRLAAVALGVPDVVGWATRRRDEGLTLEAVAAELSSAVGQPVSRETVRLWLLGTEQAS